MCWRLNLRLPSRTWLMPLPGPAILLARIQSARSLLRRNQLPMMRSVLA